MRRPSLSELPPPPAGKSGWPWTVESPPLPDALPDGRPWPRVSMATPSYNQVAYLEETLRSVLLQGYPNLEYVVIDDGSQDNSVEVIRKYEPWLAYWQTGPNRGQSAAINEGWRHGTGEIAAWLNSDDTLLPGALGTAVLRLIAPDQPDVVYGGTQYLNSDTGASGEYIPPTRLGLREIMLSTWAYRLIQPSIFFRRYLLDRVGLLDESLKWSMDYDLWLRFWFDGAHFEPIYQVLSMYRLHGQSNTFNSRTRRYTNWPVRQRFIERCPGSIRRELRRLYALNLLNDVYELPAEAWPSRSEVLTALLRSPGAVLSRLFVRAVMKVVVTSCTR